MSQRKATRPKSRKNAGSASLKKGAKLRGVKTLRAGNRTLDADQPSPPSGPVPIPYPT